MSSQNGGDENVRAERTRDLKLSYAERAWRLLFPPRCAGCGLWSSTLFCDVCTSQVRPLQAPLCTICGQAFDPRAQVLDTSVCAECRANRYHSAPPLAALRSPLEYSGPVREAIHTFKYHGKTARATQLAALLGKYLLEAEEARPLREAKPRLLMPVPLHPWRHWRRGYNQSTLLAQQLARWLAARTGEKVEIADVLRRVRYTTPQVELSGAEREHNIKGAFALDAFALEQNSWRNPGDTGAVLLIDDVTTTGATLFECARVLHKSAGVLPEQIFALTIARSG